MADAANDAPATDGASPAGDRPAASTVPIASATAHGPRIRRPRAPVQPPASARCNWRLGALMCVVAVTAAAVTSTIHQQQFYASPMDFSSHGGGNDLLRRRSEDNLTAFGEFPGTTGATVAGFYHLVLLGYWNEIFDEQMAVLEASGLMGRSERVVVHVAGENSEAFRYDTAGAYASKVQIVPTDDPRRYEYPALHAAHLYCMQNPQSYVYYIHSKGLMHQEERYRIHEGYWRRYMMYYVVERWWDCLAQLVMHGFNTCGADFVPGYVPEYLPYGDFPHYSGNFWWASCEHLAKLPDPLKFADMEHPQLVESQSHMPRMWAEFWLGDTRFGDREKMANCWEKRHKYYGYAIARKEYVGQTRCSGKQPAAPTPWDNSSWAEYTKEHPEALV